MTGGKKVVRQIGMEAAWILIGQVATIVGGLVLVRVITEYLEPSLFGELTLGLASSALVNQVLMGGVKSGVERFFSIAAEKDDLSGYLLASKQLMAYSVLAVLVIGLALAIGLIWFDYSHLMGFVAALLIFSIINGFNSTLNGLQNAARQRAVVAFHSGLNAWLKLLLAVGAILWLGTSSTAVVIGYLVASLLVTSSQLVFLRRLIGPNMRLSKKSKDWTGQMWNYSWPFAAWGSFTWAQQVSDKWALQTFGSTEDVGLYAVVFQLGYAPIGMVTGMAATLIGPILFQRWGAGDNQSNNETVHVTSWRLAYGSLSITLLGFCASFFFHEWIFKILVAVEYRAVSRYLPWVILAGGLFAAGQMLSLKLLSEMRSRDLLYIKIATALCGVAFNFAGAAFYGVSGVVAGLVSFSLLYLVSISLLTRTSQNSKSSSFL